MRPGRDDRNPQNDSSAFNGSGGGRRLRPRWENSAPNGRGLTQDDDAGLAHVRENVQVAGTAHSLVSHMSRLVSRCVQAIADPRGQVLIEQESHAGGRSG